VQLQKKGIEVEESSPEARAEMLNILEELGFDLKAASWTLCANLLRH